ncbi:MAG: ParB/RepB/Spo0J family partition protein [Clostridia bacterium]|nr:ParB/RepB/Spo0J family partition protein [Clostridia bacterium]
MMGMYTEEKNSKAAYLPIDNIRTSPYQPRKEMNGEALEELSMSIRQYGLMQPVVVRRINGYDYELIAGERRLRACRMAGMKQIPAVVVRAGGTDSAVMALIENIQRENLGYIEEAEAFCTLVAEHGITQEELAMRLGKSQSAIANKIRILRLSPEVREILAEHGLSERHARALLRLNDEKIRLKALGIIVERGLNVKKTDELVEEMLSKTEVAKAEDKTPRLRVFRDMRIFSNTIRQAVDMMKKSGIDAQSVKTENEEYIEYTIKISKNLKNAV